MTSGSAADSEGGPWGLRGDLIVTRALLWVASARGCASPSQRFICISTIAIRA
jgi:hypothetical protein